MGCARGGEIVTNNHELFREMQQIGVLYEGFITYGGMSIKEIEAINVGLQESMDYEMVNQNPIFIEFLEFNNSFIIIIFCLFTVK